MKKRINYTSFLILLGLIFFSINCSIQKNINLDKQSLKLVNREIIGSKNQNIIKLNAQKGAGLAEIENVDFTTGTIEIDLLGEDARGKSFVGIAFNIQNDSTYEAIYFRPFNFLSKEKIRRAHGIQYIYHPSFPWKRLRTENEGVYESEFINPPSPNDWFKVRINITSDNIMVVDPRTGTSLLSVKRLTESKSTKIGFWTGHNSTGGFRNLKIKK